MSKHMSQALIAIRESLVCGNCQTSFKGSDSQAYRAYYEKTPVYCSPGCKKIGMGKKVSEARKAAVKPTEMHGPCMHCGEMFPSKDPRKFCSLACYVNSDLFKEMSRKGNEVYKARCEAKRGICPVCEINKLKPGNQFCSKSCRRRYLADLFDRQIANPSTFEELQGFDEYLSQDELPCLVEGCEWRGRYLSVHLNLAHGIRARDFKIAVGFNLKTGLLSRPLKETLRDRDSGALSKTDFLLRVASKNTGKHTAYISKESREHRAKARALRAFGIVDREQKKC